MNEIKFVLDRHFKTTKKKDRKKLTENVRKKYRKLREKFLAKRKLQVKKIFF